MVINKKETFGRNILNRNCNYGLIMLFDCLLAASIAFARTLNRRNDVLDKKLCDINKDIIAP